MLGKGMYYQPVNSGYMFANNATRLTLIFFFFIMLEKYNAHAPNYTLSYQLCERINQVYVGLVTHATCQKVTKLVIVSVKMLCTMYLFIGRQCNRPNEDEECH